MGKRGWFHQVCDYWKNVSLLGSLLGTFLYRDLSCQHCYTLESLYQHKYLAAVPSVVEGAKLWNNSLEGDLRRSHLEKNNRPPLGSVVLQTTREREGSLLLLLLLTLNRVLYCCEPSPLTVIAKIRVDDAQSDNNGVERQTIKSTHWNKSIKGLNDRRYDR